MSEHSKIHVGDCLEWLRTLPDASVDSCVTDPPYGLGKEPDPREVLAAWLSDERFKPGGRGFMGKAWDAFVPSPLVWAEVFRVLKPGGHLLAFAGSRTYDWIALGVRLAGFEIRDQLMWIYGSGFPKSHNVSKAIDRAAGAEREIVGYDPQRAKQQTAKKSTAALGDFGGNQGNVTAPATEAARKWDGWHTALKPAHEPIVLARKPFRGSVAANVLKHGTGAINVDGCRIATSESLNGGAYSADGGRDGSAYVIRGGVGDFAQPQGRWPANIMHDGSAEVVAGFPVTGASGAGPRFNRGANNGVAMNRGSDLWVTSGYTDTGSAARFFYSPKASRKEREWGLDALGDYRGTTDDGREVAADNAYQRGKTQRRNIHPTVKPVALIGYLQRLITPPGGVTIDPYLGSGTAAMAATWEGFTCHGCELDTAHATIAHLRHAYALDNPCPYDQPKQEPEAEPGAQLDIFGGES